MQINSKNEKKGSFSSRLLAPKKIMERKRLLEAWRNAWEISFPAERNLVHCNEMSVDSGIAYGETINIRSSSGEVFAPKIGKRNTARSL